MTAFALSELTVLQFRSHAALRLGVDARPVAIHGANGAGKTNILEAISLLSPGRGLRGALADDLARQGGGGAWKIAAVVTGAEGAHEVETTAQSGEGRSVRIDGKAAPQAGLGRVARVLWLVPAMDRLWIEGAEGRRRFLDRATMSFEPAHAEAALAYDKAMRERNRLLKDMVRDAHWYLALEAQMAEAGTALMVNRRAALAALTAAQSAADTAFPAADLTLTHPEGDLPETAADLAAALASGRARDMSAGRTLVGPHRIDMTAIYHAKDLPASACSTGEQKALLISLILANARALATEAGTPILLLDEVAAHLDADRRAALYDEICALGAQAWMTGTGPELFAELGTRAQHLSVMERDGVSMVESG